LEISSSLTFVTSKETVILDKRIKLLEEIKKSGSISKASKAVPLSYKAAWEAVDTMNNLCEKPVVTKVKGGKNGGGTVVTEYGNRLIESFYKLKAYQDEFIKKLSQSIDFDNGTVENLERISMEISARNMLLGEIETICFSDVNAEVILNLKNSKKIVANITKSSVNSLGLEKGSIVKAIVKSSSVILSKSSQIALSARNILEGKVSKIHSESINSEICLELGESQTLVSVITTNSLDRLGIKVGDTLFAVIKSSDVIIGK